MSHSLPTETLALRETNELVEPLAIDPSRQIVFAVQGFA